MTLAAGSFPLVLRDCWRALVMLATLAMVLSTIRDGAPCALESMRAATIARSTLVGDECVAGKSGLRRSCEGGAYLQAVCLAHHAKHQEAEKRLSTLLTSHAPDRSLSWFWLGVALAAQERETEAVQSWREAGASDFFRNRGMAAFDRQEYEDAIDDLRLSLAIDSENGAAHQELGHVLMVVGRYEDAIDHLQSALAYAQDDGRTYTLLGDTYLRAHDHDRALQALRRALETDPQLARPRKLLGRLHARLGEYEAAAQHMRDAIPLVSGMQAAEYRWIMAEYLYEDGRFAEAIREGEAAIALVDDPAWRQQLVSWKAQCP